MVSEQINGSIPALRTRRPVEVRKKPFIKYDDLHPEVKTEPLKGRRRKRQPRPTRGYFESKAWMEHRAILEKAGVDVDLPYWKRGR